MNSEERRKRRFNVNPRKLNVCYLMESNNDGDLRPMSLGSRGLAIGKWKSWRDGTRSASRSRSRGRSRSRSRRMRSRSRSRSRSCSHSCSHSRSRWQRYKREDRNERRR